MFQKDFPKSGRPILNFYSPLGSTCHGLISIPHSGEDIPPEFDPFLTGNLDAYREDVDFKVNELINIEELRQNGLAVLVANIHRVAVDLNRSPNDAVLHWGVNTKGVAIRTQSPPAETREQLTSQYYWPYYELLKSTLFELGKFFKEHPVPFIDLHSMPSRPTDYHLKINPNQGSERPDFCVSDFRGVSCAPSYIKHIVKLFEKKNYSPSINTPYIGGFITQWVHQFPVKTNGVQIEIKRCLYMDEETKTLLPSKADQLRRDLTEVLKETFSLFGLKSP